MLDVAKIKFQCCGCRVLMLQTCDVEAPDVRCCMQHGSQQHESFECCARGRR
jgi:hypothetical protein